MASQEVWVHGNSGQLDDSADQGWGTATYDGAGLYLEASVQEKTAFSQVKQTPRYLWVLFHIPTPTSVENPIKLRKVMLRFSTDCNPPGIYPQKSLPYLQTYNGFAQYVMDPGGAIIDELHVLDAERQIGIWSSPFLKWQSSDITDYVVKSKKFNQDVQVNWGVGVAVRLLFINQFFVEKRLLEQPGSDPNTVANFPIDPHWDKKPWLNSAVATNTKHAWFTSVGCEFISTKP
jgi:hypothetical protein